MKLFKYILFFSAILLCSCSNYNEKEKIPVINKGIADLSGWDFDSNGTVQLNGTWEFYYGQLLEPGEFSSASPEKISCIDVPDSWDNYVHNGKKIGSYGYSTYRLNIYTGSDNPLYFKVMPPNSAYKIWANGVLSGESGKIGKNAAEESPAYNVLILDLEPVNKKIELVIQVSNYSTYLGGLMLPVTVGHREDVYGLTHRLIAFDVFIFASLIVISIYYFGLFLMRRSDRSHLFFSIFTLLLSMRSLVTNELFLYQLLPHANWEMMMKIDFLSITLCLPVFMYFIYLLYPVAITRRVRLSFVLLAAIYSFLIIFFPARVYSPYLPIYNIIILVGCVFVVYILIKAILRKSEGAKLAIAGFLLLFATVVNDILSVNNIIHTIQLSSLGVFAFILMQSFISSMKFASAYTRVEDLSRNLEIKVAIRTDELEKEKLLLQNRNEVIEGELTIARKIQKQIIPQHRPLDNIYAFYEPMDKVGGDFYDFLKYRGSNKIGIFLSDVSGHGVPAAFITLMVKTCLLQSGTDREDPSHMLLNLNELLMNLLNQTGGHFVTAFYGIYNPATREFIYSNSGHNPPFILSGGKVKTMSGKKSIPLAILDNEKLISMNKAMSNNSIILEKGDKILFYTDGLTEASSFKDKNNYFEDILVKNLIVKYGSNSPKDFILNIYTELTKFHGSDLFEDDVCMICMNID